MNINVNSLVDALSHNSVKDELLYYGGSNECDTYPTEEDLYTSNGRYKKEVQKVFNRWYKYYYDIIIEHKID